MSNRDKIKALYLKYELTPEDVFKHQHYTIITRAGIDKIQGVEKIKINYDVIKCESNFCVVKANANKESAVIETFGSAIKGATARDGNCNTWYVMEMAEKRAMSRAVLKLTGFYELGVFGEDESDDFKRK
ncbi:MAG: hypothetical protein QNK68_06235 [Flavobacteriales bacterium]